MYSDKENQYKKEKFPLNKQFTNFYSYHNLIQEKIFTICR